MRKKEGFQGQQAIVIPRKILADQCVANEIIRTLHITDIGYYPKAEFHYRERPHGADQHILIYCLEGSGRVRIRKSILNVEAGEFFVVPARTPHVYSADETNPWTIYWLHFTGSIADSIVAQIERQAGGAKGFLQFNEKTLEFFHEMYGQLERGYSSDNLVYANMCLWHYLTTFLYNAKYSPSGKWPDKDPVDQAIDFLSKKIDQALTLDQIAAAVNLSPSHFSYVFKKRTGYSPIEYFNHLKIQQACQFLLFTRLRVKEVAQELGIRDAHYFSRLFKKVMGMSPDEYREKRNQ